MGWRFILFPYFLWSGVSSLWYSWFSSSDVELWTYQGAGMRVIRLQCSWLAACPVGLGGGRELHSSGIWSLQQGVQGIKNAGWVPLLEKDYNFGLRAGGRAAHICFSKTVKTGASIRLNLGCWVESCSSAREAHSSQI